MRRLLGSLFLLTSFILSAQKEAARPDVPGNIMVDVGLNYWDSEPNFVDQAGWRSKSVGIYYTKRKAFSKKFSFTYGLGLGLEKFDLGDSLTLSSGELFNADDNDPANDSLAAFAFSSLPDNINYQKNRLAVTYLDIPVDFRFHPTGTEEGEGFFIGVGGILGLRLASHRKLKFDEAEESVIEKVKGKYNLSSVRYGLQGRIGFKGVHLFYKRYFNDLFQDPIGGANPQTTTIGINITGF
ncbi:MAG: outer membrane beta-barrel protein [Bacteroidota bacterium]